MVELDKYYVVEITLGGAELTTVAKAICIGDDGKIYSSVSPSNFQNVGDNCSATFDQMKVIREANTLETQKYVSWYEGVIESPLE
jgi:hypothetical protein